MSARHRHCHCRLTREGLLHRHHHWHRHRHCRAAREGSLRRFGAVRLAACASLTAILLASSSAVTSAATNAGTPILAEGSPVWTARIHVGSDGDLAGYSTLSEGRFGRLDRDDFSWRGTAHTVTNILANQAGVEGWGVLIDISPGLRHSPDSLTLRLGDVRLNFADARNDGNQYVWSGIQAAWHPGTTVTAVLTEFGDSFGVRSIDGWGNNQAQPELGVAGSTLVRNAPVPSRYALSGVPDSSLPGPRFVSNLVSAQAAPLFNSVSATDMVWQWGQFLDHDLSLTPAANPTEPLPVPIPLDDPVFDTSRGRTSMGFRRSAYDPATGTGPSNPRQQLNEITAFIDASNVYGSDYTRARALRSDDGTGALRSSGGGRLLPHNTAGLPNDGGDNRRDLFLAGDIRANEQTGLLALHTLFNREHNRLVGVISVANPQLDGHEVFELTRKIVGALMQAITYNEFLEVLLGPGALAPYEGYDPAVDPGIANEFSTVGYRFGHSMLPAALLHIDAAGATSEISLVEAFFNPSLVTELGISGLLRGLASREAQQVDPLMVDELRNMVFGDQGGPPRDLAALNIQRGRDHGIADYNSARIAYGLDPAADFAAVTSDPARQQALRAAYGDISRLDLWVGGLAEDHLEGSLLGEALHTIVAEQFLRLRDGDRYWYENDPYFVANPELLQTLRRTTLADVIRRNSEIGDEIGDSVFGGAPRSTLSDCLIGDVNAGYSLVAHNGDTLESIDACMQALNISEAWMMHDGEWYSRQAGASGDHDPVMAEMLDGYALAMIPLLVWSDGSAAPGAGEDEPQSWPDCFSNPVESGLTLVAFEGGSLADLNACTDAAGVTAVWALTGDEFVKYIPGGAEPANEHFTDMFDDGLPYATTLVVRGPR